MSLRNLFQEIINDRKKGLSKSFEGDDSDLLSIMLRAPSMKGNDETVKSEMFSFFLAGMKTIQITTTNLFYYVEKHPEVKEKLLAEILPPCEKVGTENIKESLDYDTVTEFTYLANVFFETMRIEAPVATANAQYSIQDITIGEGSRKFNLKKGQNFMLSIYEMHHCEEVWIRPQEFLPDRFDKESELYKMPNGQPRPSQAFNPFIGGKRVCLGKSLAEVIFRFTLPMIYHHVSLEFVDREK